MQKALLLSIYLLTQLACSPKTTPAQGIIRQDITVDGITRSYILYLPKDLPPNAPLVFVFHGYSGHAESMMEDTRMNPLADSNHFAICYPQGLVDSNGKTFWEVGYSFTQDKQVDDVRFLTHLAKYLQQKYHLSPQNTFATGMSNGADMCVMLACKAPEVFKAVAPVCGSIMKVVYNSCQNTIPIPIFMINSTADDITWWEGDMVNKQGYGAYLPTPMLFDFFVDKNACTQMTMDTLPNSNTADSSFVIAQKHIGGSQGNQVWCYKVINGKHDWPGTSGNMDIDATAEVWRFFRLFCRF